MRNKPTTAVNLLNTAALLTAVNLLGKFLGFFRDILISNYYGSTAQTDAFFLSLSIPTILIGVFTSSADSTITPQYTRISRGVEGRSGADRYFSNIILLLTIVSLVVAFVCLLWPQVIVRLFAPKFNAEALGYATRYLQIFSFSGLLHIWFCFFCAYSLCYQRTAVRTILSATTNIFVVLSLLFIHDSEMIALVLAYMLGSVLSAILPIWDSLRAGYHFSPVLSVKKYHFPEFFRLFLPIMGSALLADLLLYCDRFLSSFLAPGSLSALNYGSKVIGIFENVFVIAISAVLLPAIVRLQNDNNHRQLQFMLSAVVFALALFLSPIASVCFIYADDLISILFLRGAFNAQNAQTVSAVLQAYSPLVLFSPLLLTLTKSFHGMENTRLPFRISLATFFLNILLSATLMQFCDVFGIAAATTCSSAIGCILLLRNLRKGLGFNPTFISWKTLCKLILCLAVMVVPSLLFPHFGSSFLTLLLSGGSAVILYLAFALLLFHRELLQAWSAIRASR